MSTLANFDKIIEVKQLLCPIPFCMDPLLSCGINTPDYIYIHFIWQHIKCTPFHLVQLCYFYIYIFIQLNSQFKIFLYDLVTPLMPRSEYPSRCHPQRVSFVQIKMWLSCLVKTWLQIDQMSVFIISQSDMTQSAQFQ